MPYDYGEVLFCLRPRSAGLSLIGTIERNREHIRFIGPRAGRERGACSAGGDGGRRSRELPAQSAHLRQPWHGGTRFWDLDPGSGNWTLSCDLVPGHKP